MECIGLVLGREAGASTLYTQMLYAEMHAQIGHACSIDLVVHHLNSCPAYFNGPRRVELEKRIVEAATNLKRCGVTQLLIGSPEWHLYCDALTSRIGIPVHHICTATAGALRRLKLTPAGILGARTKAEQDSWGAYLRRFQCEILFPTSKDGDRVTECVAGCADFEEHRAEFVRIAVEFRQAGAKAIILSTPQIKYFLRAEDSLLPLVCAAEQQVRAAVAAAIRAPEATG